jgi:hypothetical protein
MWDTPRVVDEGPGRKMFETTDEEGNKVGECKANSEDAMLDFWKHPEALLHAIDKKRQRDKEEWFGVLPTVLAGVTADGYRGFLDKPVDHGAGWRIQQEPFALQVDGEEGLKDLNRYHPRLARRLIVDMFVEAQRKSGKVPIPHGLCTYPEEVEEMWSGTVEGVTALQEGRRKAKGVHHQREVAEAAGQVINYHHEYEQEFKDEYLKYAREMQEELNMDIASEFVLALVTLTHHYARRWAFEFGVELREPDDEVKAIMADPAVQALVEMQLAPHKGRFAKQLRSEIQVVR